jgi:hypothetical protein
MPRPKRTIPNPAYEAYLRDQLVASGMGYPREDMFPEEYDKNLPEDGGWILLLMDVRVGRQLPNGSAKPIRVQRLTAWYAMPTMLSKAGLHQAIINTPDGAVHVWPHEYKRFDVEQWLEFTAEDGLEIVFLNESAGFDEPSMFYLRSRGISKADAQRMLLPTLKDPNFCYFRFHDRFREIFSDGAGTPYIMGHNRERRARSHALRTMEV